MRRVVASVGISVGLLCGCGTGAIPDIQTAVPARVAQGIVHGGQQPVSGATIQLYAVGTTGYGSTPTALIGTTVTTSDGTGTMDSNANAGNANNTLPAGSFTISGDYACPLGNPLVYIAATGGNPGLTSGTNNSALVLLAALGQCNSLSASTFISINEVTTIGTVYALMPFITAGGSIGSPTDSASLQGLANGFAFVNDLVNVSTGTALTITPAGDSVQQTKIDALANVLVPCVNSAGPNSSACAALFTDATPGGAAAPTTVLGAVLDIALNPANNVTTLFNLGTANAAFQPTLSSASNVWNVNVNGGTTSACGFLGGGATVSGTVSYSGSKTGRIYLAMNNSNGCDVGTEGTSIFAPGTFTIRGVPQGTYTLQAFMDTQGYGTLNAADPAGSSATITVTGNTDAGQTVTLTDPATVALTVAPTLNTVGGFNTGAVIQYKPITNNGVEAATSYTLQWSTSSTFPSYASKTFPATGTGTNVWLVNGLSDGVYYFRAYGTSAATAIGPYSTVFGPVTVGPTATGSAVSGAISFSGTATGPMYAGLYNQDSNTVAPYLQYTAAPVSMQAYSIDAPDSVSAVYIPVAVIDQNNDGVIGPGDIANVNFQGSPISVTGATTGQSLTLPSGNALANVITQHFQSGGTQSYGLYLNVNWAGKLPVAVTLLPSSNPDGANISGPTDIASCAVPPNSCNSGNSGFQIFFNLGATAPSVGDTYAFNLTYSDGTTGTMVATVNNVLSAFATNLAPTSGTSTSTTPTFTWIDPVCSACGGYTYTFYLSGPSGTIWSVPGTGNGLAPGTTSLTWAVDPTQSSNTPSVSSLTLGTTYSWSVTVQDGNYNSATTVVSYQP